MTRPTGPIATKREQEAQEYNKYLEEMRDDFKRRYCSRAPFIASMRSFNLLQVIGSGTFGMVQLALNEVTGNYVAIKIMDKSFLVAKHLVQHVLNELKISTVLNFPFALKTLQFHQDNSYLYFFMPFIAGGDMFTHLQRRKKFTEDVARFYAAQVILTIEYMHFLNLAHRDLKPENIMINEDGYIKIMDFGFTKYMTRREYTPVGTPEYMAPELFSNNGYSFGVDWWAVGILIYEMVAGYTPFAHTSKVRMHERIARGTYQIPKSFSPSLEHLVRNLIERDTSKRLGTLRNGARDVKNHRWLRTINWMDVYYKRITPPFIPTVGSSGDISNFTPVQVDAKLVISDVDKHRDAFKDF